MGEGKGELKLRCYCCGDPITGTVALVSYSFPDAVDRVFIFKPEHTKRVDDSARTLLVLPAQ